MAQITVTVDRNMFGKRTGLHIAELGEFRMESTVSAAAAKAGLLDLIGNYSRHMTVFGTAHGETFILRQDPTGHWSYEICGPGRRTSCGCYMTTTSRAEAESRVERHIQDSFGGVTWRNIV